MVTVTSPRFANPSPDRRRRLGEVLVANGVVTPEQLTEALAVQGETTGARRRRLGQVVVDKGFASERQVAEALADLIGLTLVDLSTMVIDRDLVRVLPRVVAERIRVIVLERMDNGLKIATADPTNVIALDDVRAYTGASELQLVVATDSQIRDEIAKAWVLSEGAGDFAAIVSDIEATPVNDEPDLTFAGTDEAPTVRLVNSILGEAVRCGASDIHVEQQRDSLRVRYRVDGLLRDTMTVPRSASAAVVSRIKIISGLDIAERRIPQDGRTRLAIDGSTVDARVSSLPALHGEKIVIRLLASADTVQPLSHVGMDPQQLESLLAAAIAPQGLILITGPTGSGKTSTLYSTIDHVSTPDRNVVTLEDPVEIQLPGITQVQTNPRAGLTFTMGLRSILRQDPDVVLVGEVRDVETAELALQASMTGHLVLTTLHTNDAVSAVTRLVDMGAEPFLVASSLTLVVAQRLVRRPCDDCIGPYVPSASVLALLGLREEDLADATPMRGRGCGQCGGTGYRGRLGIFELLPITSGLRAVLLRTPTESALSAAARAAGMVTLRAAGIAKARVGQTTFEEVLRVSQADVASGRRCPACDRGLADDMVVCPWCATHVDRGHCENCARPLEAGWRICPWCRTAAAPPIIPVVDPRPALPRVLHVGVDEEARQAFAAALDGLVLLDDAATADEAMQLVSESAYDGVLVSAHLPDLAAFELVRLLRTEPRTAGLPLMMVGTRADDAFAGEALKAGADEFLALPALPLVIEERVVALADRSPRFGGAHTIVR